jgi:hypothetical protein
MHEEIRSKLNAANACYHSVQNLFVFSFAIQEFEDYTIANLFVFLVVRLDLSENGKNID